MTGAAGSMVGEYGELILSVLVMPRVAPGAPLPRSAFYPFLLGTTTKASREHADEYQQAGTRAQGSGRGSHDRTALLEGRCIFLAHQARRSQ